MRCCWGTTDGCVLITVPIALWPLGRRTIGFFGELELFHHAPAGVRAYAINPVASGGGFHFRYDGAVGVTLSDEPLLLTVDLVCSSGSQALTGHYLVDMFSQSDLPSEEHFVASRRQVIPLVGMSNLEPGDLLGVAHAPLMCVPLDALQHDGRPSSDPPGVTPVSAVTASSLAAAAATASPSPALLEHLTPEQRGSFLRVWERLPSHLWAVAFDLHGPGWTPLAMEQLGDVLCDFADAFSKSKTDFGYCSLMPFEISVPEDSAPVTSRPHRINPLLAKEVDTTLNQYLAANLIQHSTSPHSSPLVVIPKKSGGVRITVNYKKLNKVSNLSQLPIPRVDQVLDSLGMRRMFPCSTWFLRSVKSPHTKTPFLSRRFALPRASMN